MQKQKAMLKEALNHINGQIDIRIIQKKSFKDLDIQRRNLIKEIENLRLFKFKRI